MIFHKKLKLLHRLAISDCGTIPQSSALPRAFVSLKRNNHQQFLKMFPKHMRNTRVYLTPVSTPHPCIPHTRVYLTSTAPSTSIHLTTISNSLVSRKLHIIFYSVMMDQSLKPNSNINAQCPVSRCSIFFARGLRPPHMYVLYPQNLIVKLK